MLGSVILFLIRQKCFYLFLLVHRVVTLDQRVCCDLMDGMSLIASSFLYPYREI